jgi:hypothetical protein
VPVVLGPELLTNGDFSASTGIGAASSVGPGWTTSYLPCGPNLFTAPCGASRYAFFTTNAGQVTGGVPSANTIPALGGRSMAVNVGPNTAIPIIEWANIPLVNGQTYRLAADAGIIGPPYSIAIRIAGGAQGSFTVNSPSGVGQWQSTVTDFVFAGPTGNYSVGLFSNSGAAGGNDLTFDNISLRSLTGNPDCDCCPLPSICGTAPALVDPQFSRDLGSTGRVAVPGGFTFADFAGSGVDVTITSPNETLTAGGTTIGVGVSPPKVATINVTFSQPVQLRRFGIWDLDAFNNAIVETAANFVPQFTGVFGSKVIVPVPGCAAPEAVSGATNQLGSIRGGANDETTGGALFNGPLTTSLTFDIVRCAGGAGQALSELAFDLPSGRRRVFACRHEDGSIEWFDATGAVVPATDVELC